MALLWPVVFGGLAAFAAVAAGPLTVAIHDSASDDDWTRDVRMQVEDHPFALKYDGSALGAVDMRHLRYLTANITSDTSATFDAPGWKHPVEGEFQFDEANSNSSILRGNFSFIAPHFLTTSTSIPPKWRRDPDEKIPILPRSDVADGSDIGETVTSTIDSLLSFGSRLSKDVLSLVTDIGDGREDTPPAMSESISKRATQEGEPPVISGQWVTYPASLPASKRKEVFNSYYEHARQDTDEQDGKSMDNGARLSEYTEFLSDWDEQCLKERFPLCCSANGLCV